MYLKFVCLLVFLFYGLRLDTLHTICPELQSKRVEASSKIRATLQIWADRFHRKLHSDFFVSDYDYIQLEEIKHVLSRGACYCVCFYAGTFAGPGNDTVTTNRWQKVPILISSLLNEWFMIHSKWLIQLVTKQIAVFINGMLNHWFIRKQIHSVMKHCNVALRHTNILLRLCLELELFGFFLRISLAKQKKNIQWCVTNVTHSILTCFSYNC